MSISYCEEWEVYIKGKKKDLVKIPPLIAELKRAFREREANRIDRDMIPEDTELSAEIFDRLGVGFESEMREWCRRREGCSNMTKKHYEQLVKEISKEEDDSEHVFSDAFLGCDEEHMYYDIILAVIYRNIPDLAIAAKIRLSDIEGSRRVYTQLRYKPAGETLTDDFWDCDPWNCCSCKDRIPKAEKAWMPSYWFPKRKKKPAGTTAGK